MRLSAYLFVSESTTFKWRRWFNMTVFDGLLGKVERLTCNITPLVQYWRSGNWWNWRFVIQRLLNVDGECVWRNPCSVVGSLFYLNRVLVELKCDVLWSDVPVDSWQDYVFLVYNEHEIVLSTSITKPIKVHVHSFGYALDKICSDDAVGNDVFKLIFCWTLDVENFI